MKKNPIKIILLGLDNSGKTSISLILQRKPELSNFTSLSFTKNHETISFKDLNTNTEFVIWDFGGQTSDRENHLKDLLKDYITGTNKIIYVIDIQDNSRYGLALKYLSDIIKELKRGKIILNISIFLHKFDPNLEITEENLFKLINKIHKIIPENYNYEIFKTSIYAIFHKSPII